MPKHVASLARAELRLARGVCKITAKRLKAGTKVSLIPSLLPEEAGNKAQETALEIVHLDTHIVVVNKPFGTAGGARPSWRSLGRIDFAGAYT